LRRGLLAPMTVGIARAVDGARASSRRKLPIEEPEHERLHDDSERWRKEACCHASNAFASDGARPGRIGAGGDDLIRRVESRTNLATSTAARLPDGAAR